MGYDQKYWVVLDVVQVQDWYEEFVFFVLFLFLQGYMVYLFGDQLWLCYVRIRSLFSIILGWVMEILQVSGKRGQRQGFVRIRVGYLVLRVQQRQGVQGIGFGIGLGGLSGEQNLVLVLEDVSVVLVLFVFVCGVFIIEFIYSSVCFLCLGERQDCLVFGGLLEWEVLGVDMQLFFMGFRRGYFFFCEIGIFRFSRCMFSVFKGIRDRGLVLGQGAVYESVGSVRSGYGFYFYFLQWGLWWASFGSEVGVQ